MTEGLGLVISSRRGVRSNAETLISVATSVIEYGLLQAALALAISK